MGELGSSGEFCCSMTMVVAEVTQVGAFSKGTSGSGTAKVVFHSPGSLGTWYSVTS